MGDRQSITARTKSTVARWAVRELFNGQLCAIESKCRAACDTYDVSPIARAAQSERGPQMHQICALITIAMQLEPDLHQPIISTADGARIVAALAHNHANPFGA